MRAPDTSTAPMAGNVSAILAGALAVFAAGALVVSFLDFGPLSAHMAAHIVIMNVAAPLLALVLPTRVLSGSGPARLWTATVVQMILLWAAHAPAVHHHVHSSVFAAAGIYGALFVSAFAFWKCILDVSPSRWQAMMALLASGKLACLLGGLLVFAPRLLFEAAAGGHTGHVVHAGGALHLSDQHLAGLLMLAACPLSYVLTAIVLAAKEIFGPERAISLHSLSRAGPIGR